MLSDDGVVRVLYERIESQSTLFEIHSNSPTEVLEFHIHIMRLVKDIYVSDSSITWQLSVGPRMLRGGDHCYEWLTQAREFEMAHPEMMLDDIVQAVDRGERIVWEK